MERAKLIVKNFGPLKDIEIEVREMVAFIGAQASGKSTLAKLLSILEDEKFRSDDTIAFEDELKKYNLFSYIKKDSYISYNNINYLGKSPFSLDYDKGVFTKGTTHRYLSFIKDAHLTHKMDAEEINEHILKMIVFDINDCLLNNSDKFLSVFSNEKQAKDFKKEFNIDKKFLHLSQNDIEKLFIILGKETTTENYIELYEKLVSLFPNLYLVDSIYIPSERSFLHLIEGNTLGLINNKINIPTHILNIGQEYEKALNTIKEIPLSLIDKKFNYKREGKTSYIYHNQNERINLLESSSGLQSIIPILLLVEYSKSLKEEYNFNFIVEEPELNLYPKTQHELIKYLVKNCLLDGKNLILTTHSPFILASINNLLLAFDKGQNRQKEVNKIVKNESWINPKNFIAYQLKNGKATKIMDDKLGQIKENVIDVISDNFSIEFDKLLDL